MDDLFIYGALALHVAGGYAALVSGIFVMALPKGGKRHVRIGRLYFRAMMVVAASGFLLSALRGSQFLFQIGVFVFYQAVAGFRSARIRNRVWERGDVLLAVAALVNGVWMIFSAQPVPVVFGVISLLLATADLRVWRRARRGLDPEPRHWLARHIGMMIGAYIGTLTAFLVVNVNLGSWNWVLWLGPTALLVPLIVYWTAKYTRPKKTASAMLFFCGLFIAAGAAQAQPYIEGGNTRHRFAQLCLGTQWRGFSSAGSSYPRLDLHGNVKDAPVPAFGETRLVIAGTHFWGHADFYITVPLPLQRGNTFPLVETGFRVMPLRIRKRRLSPFAGAAWLPVAFREGQGARLVSDVFPLSAGVFFHAGRHLFDVACGYSLSRERAYYVAPATKGVLSLPRLFFSVGYRVMLETTASAEKAWSSGRTRRLTDTLAKRGRLNSWTLAAGASSSFFVGHSPSWQARYPYAGRHYAAMIFPEISAGYYWHRPDVQVSAVFRAMGSRAGGFGYSQHVARRALTFEAYRFVGDYHGFVPFAGPAVSLERWTVSERFPGGEHSAARTMIAPGLTFGWDIRPDRLQFFYLRTALRWIPLLEAAGADGVKLTLDQLEVNFIQVVLLPGRLRG